MALFGYISSRLSANDEKVNALTSPSEVQAPADEPVPSTSRPAKSRGKHTTTTHGGHDGIHKVEDQVLTHIASHLRGASIVILPTTNEESGSDEDAPVPTRRKAKGTSGKVRTADNTVVNQVTWLHEVIYTCSSEPATYEDFDSMGFVNRYLTVMTMEPEHIKAKMLTYL